jgi:hypothetical protein
MVSRDPLFLLLEGERIMFLLSRITKVPLLKKSLLACAAAGGLSVGAADAVEAGHYYSPRYNVQVQLTTRTTTTAYRTVRSYETRREPYYCSVIRYDHCGRPYRATVVQYRTVRVPVQKLVRVSY